MRSRFPLDTSFVRIGSDWTTTQARQVLEAVKPRRAIVQYAPPAGTHQFYAFDYDDILELLGKKPKTTVWDMLRLESCPTVPAVTLFEGELSEKSVVLDGGLIMGLAFPPVREMAMRGGTTITRGGTEAALAQRALSASAPPEVALGGEVSLLVKITKDLAQPGTLPISVRAGETVEVVLQASAGLAVKASAEGTLIVTDEDETAPLRFKIAGTALGPSTVSVYAFKDGKSIGSIKVAIAVVETVADVNPRERSSEFRAPAALPDLSLYVFEDKAAHSYTMRLHASNPALMLNMSKYGPIRLTTDAEAFFAKFYRDIESILSGEGSARAKLEALGKKGTYLFDRIVPKTLQEQLWKLRKRIGSVQIQSEEPWIPWELLKLFGREDGKIVEGGFLCEEFAVTRWLLELPQHAELTMNAVGLVVPADSNLRNATIERREVMALGGAARSVTEIPATAVELRNQLRSAKYDALHFTGHGSALTGNADRSEIVLQNDEPFSPEDLTGEVANLGLMKPLVFLNACEVGRAGMSLVGMGGWAHGFLKAGAGAFIGPYWKVADGTAAVFAKAFYENLLQGSTTISEAVRRARTETKTASDPTWLAYTVYAHPDARVVGRP